MTEQDPSIKTLEKEIDWTSSIGVTIPVYDATVYQRMEKINPTLLDDGVLRIQLALKLFAIVTTEHDYKHVLKPAGVFTNDVKINSFIDLHPEIRWEDIMSIDHQVLIKSYAPRPDKIIVNGTLKLNVSYVLHLVLDGTVTEFTSNAPVNGAVINAMDKENREIIASTNTGSNGRYFFNNLSPGIYLIEALTDSHKPEQKISVIKTRDTVNFVLHQ